MNQEKVNQALKLPYLKKIADAEQFFFQIAQNKLKEWIDVELSEELEERLMELHDDYHNFQEEAREDERLERILHLLFEIISYCDTKAKDKHKWNQYEDKRALARASVRMQYWVKHLILFKLDRDQLRPESSTVHAFEYLLYPENQTTILSKNHRQQMSKNLLSKKYEPGRFVEDLKKYFEQFNLKVSNESNYTYLIASIIYNNDELWKTDSSGEETEFDDDHVTNISLNQILYGPPGTGKTYKTKALAVSIVEDLTIAEMEEIYGLDRREVLKKYNRYMDEGKIAFTTFHQSFTYEDFVEGIKPVLNQKTNTNDLKEASSRIEYEVRDGIFKMMADKAASYDIYAEEEQEINFDNLSPKLVEDAQFFKMSLGDSTLSEDEDIYRYCIENDCVALGWGRSIDFTTVDNKSGIEKKLKEEVGEVSKFELTAVRYFRLTMRIGDVIVVSDGNKKFRAIGIIRGNYYFDPNSEIEYNHFRKIKWLLKDVSIPSGEIYRKIFSQQTLYRLDKKWLKSEFFEQDDTDDRYILRNHVIIIDEINRGNISSIFGELITLLEPDKRSGKQEAIQVKLPYSQEDFTVPSNLYIIGTMNTADRSVEALDTALRRRFSFTEVGPKPELLSPKSMILSLLNMEAYADKDWEEEPYSSHASSLYAFLGVEKELAEAPLKKIMEEPPEGEEIFWKERDLAHLNDTDFKGIRLDQLLSTINNRIRMLIDQDHTIGHAYFMGIATASDPWGALQDVFHRNILPLLQEYFFGDHSKIGLVLGSGFVFPDKPAEEVGFADFEYTDMEGLAGRKLYKLVNVADMPPEEFQQAVRNILPAKKTESDG